MLAFFGRRLRGGVASGRGASSVGRLLIPRRGAEDHGFEVNGKLSRAGRVSTLVLDSCQLTSNRWFWGCGELGKGVLSCRFASLSCRVYSCDVESSGGVSE